MVRHFLPEDATSIQQSVGAAIAILCTANDMTPEDLAGKLGKDHGEVYGWITGKVIMSIPELFDVGKLFSVTVDWFLDAHYNNSTYANKTQHLTGNYRHQAGLLEMAGRVIAKL